MRISRKPVWAVWWAHQTYPAPTTTGESFAISDTDWHKLAIFVNLWHFLAITGKALLLLIFLIFLFLQEHAFLPLRISPSVE